MTGPTEQDPDEDFELGDVAQDALNNAGEQGVLDDTDMTRVKFVGMAYNGLKSEDIKIGTEMEFVVRGRCIAVGDETSKKDDQIRHVAKMDVLSVSRIPK